MKASTMQSDVAVVGGGLAGLTAAVSAARSGATVHLFEARRDSGGRAATTERSGFQLNQGPHAWFPASTGAAVLREWGIVPTGGRPPLFTAGFHVDGRVRRLPPPRALSQLAGLLRRLGADRRDHGLASVSAEEWIGSRMADPTAREFAAAAVRVSSYCADLATLSADAAALQLHTALRGIVYVHDGWSRIVEALGEQARAAGVTIQAGAKIVAVDVDGSHIGITGDDGQRLVARSIVIAAGGPATAARLVGGRSAWLGGAAASAIPARAACLDLGLRRLTKRSSRFVLGVDTATYAGVHTPGAHLARDGHVVHLMHYEPCDRIDVGDLEALADELQPGWRDHEVCRQVGRRRVVAFDRPQPGRGLRGRPGPEVEDLPGVFVGGDWVGPTDMLASAAITSGRAAGLAASRYGSSRPTFHPTAAPS